MRKPPIGTHVRLAKTGGNALWRRRWEGKTGEIVSHNGPEYGIEVGSHIAFFVPEEFVVLTAKTVKSDGTVATKQTRKKEE